MYFQIKYSLNENLNMIEWSVTPAPEIWILDTEIITMFVTCDGVEWGCSKNGEYMVCI